MISEKEKTCETCRFITYTRTARGGPQSLFCENPELQQKPPEAKNGLFFIPPKLAYSCNRWAVRRPDLGFVPQEIALEPQQILDQEA